MTQNQLDATTQSYFENFCEGDLLHVVEKSPNDKRSSSKTCVERQTFAAGCDKNSKHSLQQRQQQVYHVHKVSNKTPIWHLHFFARVRDVGTRIRNVRIVLAVRGAAASRTLEL